MSWMERLAIKWRARRLRCRACLGEGSMTVMERVPFTDLDAHEQAWLMLNGGHYEQAVGTEECPTCGGTGLRRCS